MPEDTSEQSSPGRSWLDRISQFFGNDPSSREDLLGLIHGLKEKGILDGDTLGIIEGALQVADMPVREIMIPRAQMISIRDNESPREFLPTIIRCAHSRFPVIGDDPDEVLGIMLAKDLLSLALEPDKVDRFQIKDLVRPALVIPESKRLDSLLKDFRDSRNHMAIVVNEYGGVAGLVTIEDVLEQIVGEIEDEHDFDDDDHLIKEIDDKEFTVKALTPIEDFCEFFEVELSHEEFDTIGGLVLQRFGRLPGRGESVDLEGFRFTVLSADGRTIRLMRVIPLPANGEDSATAEQ